MRKLAIVGKEESLMSLLKSDFLASRNNIIVICNDKINYIEQHFVEHLNIANELILQREHEQQCNYFTKMTNAPTWKLRLLIPSVPASIKNYIRKNEFKKQYKFWGYLWPHYRKMYLDDNGGRCPLVQYVVGVFALPRISSLFSFFQILKIRGVLSLRQKLRMKFSEAEFEQALLHRIDFHDPDMIFCDSKKLERIAQKLELCEVCPLEY